MVEKIWKRGDRKKENDHRKKIGENLSQDTPAYSLSTTWSSAREE